VAESILNSWKDIAAHLNTSVRTAQRWEAELRLPVHRPGNGRKGPILAFTGELDQWLKDGKSRGGWKRVAANGKAGGALGANHKNFAHTQHSLKSLTTLAERINNNTLLLQQQLRRALELRKSLALRKTTQSRSATDDV